MKRTWTLEEEEILHKYYHSEGFKGVHKRMPYRTSKSIRSKACYMGMRLYQGESSYEHWSARELKILKKNMTLSTKMLQKFLPNRTQSAICHGRRILTRQLKMQGKPVLPRGWWTPDEDAILQRYYPIEGIKCEKRLPNRTRIGIVYRATRLAIKCDQTKRIVTRQTNMGVKQIQIALWSQKEIDLLKKNINLGLKALQKLFPDRTGTAIQCKQRELKRQLIMQGEPPFRGQYWTPDEDAILQRYYPIEGGKCEKRLPNRTHEGVIYRAGCLGIKCYQTKRIVTPRTGVGVKQVQIALWSQKEIDLLKKNIDLDIEALQKRLPGRTQPAILAKQRELKKRLRGELPPYRQRWTSDEEAILRRYYPTEGVSCQKRLPTRNQKAVRQRANVLGIKRETTWSQKQLKILKENLTLDLGALQKLFPERTQSAVLTKRDWMRKQLRMRGELPPIEKKRPWSCDEEAILRRYYPTEGMSCKKRLPTRTRGSIKHRVQVLGVKFNGSLKMVNDQ